jgi:hypothetical protein
MSQPGCFFAHGFSFQLEFIGIVDEAIEDGIGHGGIADEFVPVFDGKLARDQGGAQAMAVVEDFQQEI